MIMFVKKSLRLLSAFCTNDRGVYDNDDDDDDDDDDEDDDDDNDDDGEYDEDDAEDDDDPGGGIPSHSSSGERLELPLISHKVHLT